MALQECGRFEEAERLAERSLVQAPRNASAVHALTHVLQAAGNDSAVLRFLENWLTGYEREAPFYCHLAWHLALTELSLGMVQASLDRYEREIAPLLRARPAVALADAASLLWRHRLRDEAAGLPWPDVVAAADAVAARSGSAFLDVHAALALAAAGGAGAFAELVLRLRRLTVNGDPLAGEVTLPLALGIGAFAAGDYTEATRRIAPLAGEIVRLGGSNAQREVVEETLREARRRAGRPIPARVQGGRADGRLVAEPA